MSKRFVDGEKGINLSHYANEPNKMKLVLSE